ncbi:RagB/SusD family nutrient uptake outer membrane protein [Flammeovirga sp. MY04]|uniref:RagB/SusD family nutrient uptake outer membrane protein n=1 Tax=Flammeovirga sp. MY04 TaxID=1191459 RepID=UPI000806315B|nr:RagB/SusD family nutrient uptake outer membrane protein [Flammeovirga sp. MY04]ANQ52555.1 RagB/SusD family nutrient uptake outer membrane protein [Flammeovirga sp. MY04]
MMKLKSNIAKSIALIAVLGQSLFFSCVKFEDVGPTDEFPGSEVDASTFNIELVINEGYLLWANAHLSNHLPDANLIADHTAANIDGAKLGGNKNKFEYIRTEFQNGGMWSNAYKSINQANLVLSVTESDGGIDSYYEFQRGRLRGEALFLRAANTFLLLRYHGAQYSAQTKDMPGVIIKTKPAEDFNGGGRSTVQECYDFILDDLTKAAELIPVTFDNTIHQNFPSYKIRARRFDVLALKARVLFQMNRMDEAEELITSLIGFQPGVVTIEEAISPAPVMELTTAQNATTLFSNSGATEALNLRSFVAGFAVSDPYNLMFNVDQITDGEFSAIFLSKDFISNYVDDKGLVINDEYFRMSSFIREAELEDAESGEVTDTVYVFNKFSLDLGSTTNWPTLRLEELILMRAEIRALNGQVNGALPDINLLRANRDAMEITSAPSKQQMIEIVAHDRALELIGEGERFFNWKRMGAYNETVAQVYPESVYKPFDRGNVLEIKWNSPETLYRLPLNEIQNNQDLSNSDQNP